jgi:hypothetical protein
MPQVPMPRTRPLARPALLLAVALTVACAPDAAVSPPSADPAPQFARQPSTPAPQLDYHLIESFVDVAGATQSSAITNAAGAPVEPYAYVNGVCGVWGTLNTQTTSKDALLDPDKNYTSTLGSCGPRHFTLEVRYANGSAVRVNDGSYVTVGSVGSTPSGTAQSQRVGFQLTRAGDQATGCAYVRYGYPGDLAGSDPALVTNTSPVGSAKNTWTVESTGTHQPVCWKTSGERVLLAPMPFKLTIRER